MATFLDNIGSILDNILDNIRSIPDNYSCSFLFFILFSSFCYLLFSCIGIFLLVAEHTSSTFHPPLLVLGIAYIILLVAVLPMRLIYNWFKARSALQ